VEEMVRFQANDPSPMDHRQIATKLPQTKIAKPILSSSLVFESCLFHSGYTAALEIVFRKKKPRRSA